MDAREAYPSGVALIAFFSDAAAAFAEFDAFVSDVLAAASDAAAVDALFDAAVAELSACAALVDAAFWLFKAAFLYFSASNAALFAPSMIGSSVADARKLSGKGDGSTMILMLVEPIMSEPL